MGKLIPGGERDGRDSSSVWSFATDSSFVGISSDELGVTLSASLFQPFSFIENAREDSGDFPFSRASRSAVNWIGRPWWWRRRQRQQKLCWWWWWWWWCWWRALRVATPNFTSSCVLLLLLLTILELCRPVSTLAVQTLNRSTSLEDLLQKDDRSASGVALEETELEIIRRSIARGLGLERMPDPFKANVSQAEYERAHREYLRKLQSSFNGQTSKRLHVFHATAYPGNESSHVCERGSCDRLFFPVKIPEEGTSMDHATLRLLLHGHYSGDERSDIDILLYLKTFNARKLMVRERMEVWREPRWLEFDSTLPVSLWLEAGLENLGLELEFLRNGQPVRCTFSSPVLNVFTTESIGRPKRSTPKELMSLHKGRRTKCKGESKKCCRHELTVMFKDLKGFEFIVYPKTFDAGYCKGRCPPRYNPAHHHALLQSLLWKEDRKRVPKPCCAPSKLEQLMIVYFDENDSTRLKVSTWKNIQVLECACS